MPAKEYRYDGDCRIAIQAICQGRMDAKVLAVSARASKTGQAHLCVRVGRVLVYVEDREALTSFTEAWQDASRLGEELFPPPADLFDLAEARARRDFEKSRRARP